MTNDIYASAVGHDLVARSLDAVVWADRDAMIRSWNVGAQRLCGYTTTEIVGEPLMLLVPEERWHEFDTLLDRVLADHPTAACEMAWLAKNGRPLDVAVSISPVLDDTGTVDGVCLIARDVTEQRWLASALDVSVRKLQSAMTELRDADTRCQRFLADVAHQLRTPIAGIRASSETLMRVASNTEREKLLSALVSETVRAARVVDSLMRMVRLDRGEPLSRQPCDPVRLCRHELDRYRSLNPVMEFELEIGELPAEPPELDGHAVREILSNLLDNAVRYADSRVKLASNTVDSVLELRVIDDGPGLSPLAAEQAFERFVTLDPKGGTGLGLAIARELAEAHGGSLSYEGNAFVVRLPVGEREPQSS